MSLRLILTSGNDWHMYLKLKLCCVPQPMCMETGKAYPSAQTWSNMYEITSTCTFLCNNLSLVIENKMQIDKRQINLSISNILLSKKYQEDQIYFFISVLFCTISSDPKKVICIVEGQMELGNYSAVPGC